VMDVMDKGKKFVMIVCCIKLLLPLEVQDGGYLLLAGFIKGLAQRASEQIVRSLEYLDFHISLSTSGASGLMV
jgi:hypothetical protein